MRISVLDQSPVAEGETGQRALHNTLDLAVAAERLGYHRYWVAEHHGSPMLSGAAPEVLIAAISARTRRIRVGSGGVMLPHYSPLKVAEVFSILAALAPGRVDLALGRAAGTDPLTTFALQRDRRAAAPDDFPQQLAELLAYLDATLPDEHPFNRLQATLPGRPARPTPWLLGSSAQSAIWAGQLGLPYAFADFINPAGAQITALYREHFAAAGHGHSPQTAVAAWALCAESEAEAQRLASSSRMTLALLHRGELIPVPAPEKALAFLARERAAAGDQPPGHRRERRAIIGEPAQVRSGLERLAADYGAEEVIVVTITYDHRARVRSYELIAEAFQLSGGNPSRSGGRDLAVSGERSPAAV
jgi:luciferase family oxidoreductase group 1